MLIPLSQPQNVDARQGFFEIPGKNSGLIDFLRVTHQLCRTKPKIDLLNACDMLKAYEKAALSAYVETLVRGLPAALQRVVNFHNPGCEDLSFDEAWLVRTIQCHVLNDENSLTFLLESRVRPEVRPHLMYLIGKISCCLD
tara:strand:- start:8 stop:430 length:423 start_codon:yes stop_codon:yes gene_type:complete